MYLIAPLTCFNRSVALMVKGKEFDYVIDFESLQDISGQFMNRQQQTIQNEDRCDVRAVSGDKPKPMKSSWSNF